MPKLRAHLGPGLIARPAPSETDPAVRFDYLIDFTRRRYPAGGATRAGLDAACLPTWRPRWRAGAYVFEPMTAKQKGVDMKTALRIATVAFFFAAGPIATTIDMPLARPVANSAVAEAANQKIANVWDGRWQGTTVSGQPLVLDLVVKGQRMTGRLIVGKQSANITAGKVVDEAFALTTGPIDGHSVAGTGRLVGDAIELTIDGVKEPLTLVRIK